jgi:hypothetical protein
MNRFGKIFFMLLALSTVLVGMAFAQATVTTDKDDYQPGDYVIVTGTGWTPPHAQLSDGGAHQPRLACKPDPVSMLTRRRRSPAHLSPVFRLHASPHKFPLCLRALVAEVF